MGVFFGENDIRNVSERVKGKQSNNTGELFAIIKVFDVLSDDLINYDDSHTIIIYTDSEYAIKCCTDYGYRVSKTTKKVPNKELVLKAYNLFQTYPNVHLRHIRSHTGFNDIHSKGNEQADRLASESLHDTNKNKTVATFKQLSNRPPNPNYKLTFGRYQDWTLKAVYDVNPNYLVWCTKNIKNNFIKSEIKIFMNECDIKSKLKSTT